MILTTFNGHLEGGKFRNKAKDIFFGYTESASVQGLFYIFDQKQSIIGRVFWTLVVSLMFILGFYWCVQQYQDWKSSPVTTSISSAAPAVEMADFPSVTICTSGRVEENIELAFFKILTEFLQTETNAEVVDPLDIVNSRVNTSENFKNVTDWLQTIMTGPLYEKFINESLPGLKPSDDILGFLKVTASTDPTSYLKTRTAIEGGFDFCASSKKDFWAKVKSVCDPGFFPDFRSGFCYKVASEKMTVGAGENFCQTSLDSELIYFDTNFEVVDFITAVQDAGFINMDELQFYLMATRHLDDTGFSFPQERITPVTFPNISTVKDKTNRQCLTGLVNMTRQHLDLRPADCLEEHVIICREVMMLKPDCGETLKGNTLDLLLDPDNRAPMRRATTFRKAEMVDVHQRIDFGQAFPNLFEILLNSNLPCSEKTSNFYSSGAFLRSCEWKGQEVPCGSIFTAYPTDSGVCCSFNMGAADEILKESVFSKTLAAMQSKDKLELVDSGLPDWSEASPGVSNSLVLLLDARSDQVSSATRDGPDNGLATVFVGSPGNFPLVNIEGIEILAGHDNVIDVTSTKVDADDTVSPMNPMNRNCYFPEESRMMKVFQKYTHWNCKVECVLSFVLDQMKALYGVECEPWFLPGPSGGTQTCDAWQSSNFMKLFRAKSLENLCDECLPDCTIRIYEATSSSVPFTDCDLNNLGSDKFCDINSDSLLTEKFSNKIKTNFQMNNSIAANLPYVRNLGSSMRPSNKDISYIKASKAYNAFERDIAMVEIIYVASTLFVYQRSSTENWINYLADVGGLLGIVLGMGFVSFIEVFWLIVRLLSAWLGCRGWIS